MGGASNTPPLVGLESRRGTIHLVLSSPILDRSLLVALESALRELASDPQPRPLVLRSAHATVFLAGAHLGEIAALDDAASDGYAARGRRVVGLLEAHPAPTVAAVHGSCSGGGFDLVLSCDAIFVGPRASFHHPGVLRGLITGWSGTTTIPATLGPARARAAFLEGSPVNAAAAVACGLAWDEVHDPAAAATQAALRLSGLDPLRIALWRRFRGACFVDRFRASMVHK